ncbi:MAG: PAS domain-containing protein, partial [Desulfobacteraceae bacterium]
MGEHDLWNCRYVSQIVNAMADGVFTITPEGKIASWNSSMEKITGYTEKDAVGKDCTFIHFSTCTDGTCPTGIHDCGILESQNEFSRECIIKSKSGEEIPVLKRAKTLLDEKNSLTAVVETVTDLRELKKARQRAAEAQSRLAMNSGTGNIIGISRAVEDLVL